METQIKEVYFDQYCSKCKHKDVYEGDDPCNDCLALGWNENSHKPQYFKPADVPSEQLD